MTSLHRASLVLAAGWWAATGCNDRPVDDDPIPAEVRAYARARCLRIEQCACSNVTHVDRAECEGRIVAVYQQAFEGREGILLSCFAQGAELWRSAQCDDPPVDPPCNALTPMDPEDSPCRINPLGDAYVHADSCAEGLVCFDEHCVEPVVSEAPGAPCQPGGQCHVTLTCIDDRCEVPRASGDACDETWDCMQPDLYCAAGRCATRTSSGGACASDEECEYTVLCEEGRCTPITPQLCVLGEMPS